MTNPNVYCQSYIKPGSDDYYSLCFVSNSQKKALIALYAWYHEIISIPKKCQEPSVAEAKLNWWQLEIGAMYDDEPQHPITKALKPILSEIPLSKTYFYSLISGVQLLLHFDQYSTIDDLIADAQNLKAPLFGLMFEIMRGKKDKPSKEESEKNSQAIAEFAVYARIFDIIVHLKSDLLHNKLFVPEQELLRMQLDMAQLFQFKLSDSLLQLFAELKMRAEKHLRAGLQYMQLADYPFMHPVFILLGLTEKRFSLLAEEGYPVFSHQVDLPAIRKYWLSRKIRSACAGKKEKNLVKLLLK